MIHLYYGDGKGKTTAAVGLAVRAAGSGMRVLFVQFFKDGSSSEVGALSSLPGIETRNPTTHFGRYRTMTDAQKVETHANYDAMLRNVIDHADEYDLIVLDEAVSAYRYGMLPRDVLLAFLDAEGQKREIVLTGRDPAGELVLRADYVTCMCKEKHPFDHGILARKGIEY